MIQFYKSGFGMYKIFYNSRDRYVILLFCNNIKYIKFVCAAQFIQNYFYNFSCQPIINNWKLTASTQ